MSLSDIMSHSNLAVYPQVALILFLVVFATVAARALFSRRKRAEYARASMLPLEQDSIPSSSTPSSGDAT